jgi:CMP-N-acetylneuraminic acid synthetase
MTGQRIKPYLMPGHRMLDIDEPSDLDWAEFLLSHGRY